MRIAPSWACLLVPVLAAGAQAQTYTIKLKSHPDPGKSVVHHETEKQTGTVKVVDPDGKLLNEQKPSESKEEVFTETVLEQAKGAKHPTKFKRVYEKAVTSAADKATTRSHQGRTVLFELKDGQYQVAAEGQPALDAKDLEKLAKSANDALKSNSDEVFLPKTPVTVGQSWKIDTKALADMFGAEGELDIEKSKADGRLVKVYQKDGKQFGIIEADLKLAMKSMGPLKFSNPATFDAKATLDTTIDGSSTGGTMTMAGKIVGKTDLDMAGMKLTIDLAMDISGKEERSAEK